MQSIQRATTKTIFIKQFAFHANKFISCHTIDILISGPFGRLAELLHEIGTRLESNTQSIRQQHSERETFSYFYDSYLYKGS